MARIHRKINNQRLDFTFKLTKDLAERYDELYFEDLNMKGMQKLWGRKVSDLAFGDFLKIQEYRCHQYSDVFAKIDRFEPTTPICSVCGYRHPGLGLNERSWTCPICGTVHDRDINSATNVYKVGRSLSTSLGNVRPIYAVQKLAIAV